MSKGTGSMRGQRKPRNIDIIKQQNKVIVDMQNLINIQGGIIKDQMKKIEELKK